MRRNSNPFALAAVSFACILLLAACNSSVHVPTLKSITVSPATQTIVVPTTQQFTAIGNYSDGSNKPGIAVTWSSSNAAVATIDMNSGVATSVTAGTTSITATASGVTSTPAATLNVNQLTSIAVTPATMTITPPATQQYKATGTYKDFDGTTPSSDITSQVNSANGWNSSNKNAATIDNTGLATAVAAGSTNITATLAGVLSNPPAVLTVSGVPVAVSLLVTPATPTAAIGNQVTFQAVELWSDNSQHFPSGAVTWTSGTPATATILASTPTATAVTALSTALAVGTTTIKATEGALTPGTALLTVVTGSAHFAYVANNGDSTIDWFTVQLPPVAGNYLVQDGTYTKISSPLQVILHPNGKYMYVTDTPSDVYLLYINPDGSFDFPAAYPATLNEPQALAGSGKTSTFGVIDPYGRFLYVSDSVGNTIYGFTISQTDGTLTAITGTGATFTTNLNAPQMLLVDPTGNYLFAINQSNNTVSVYSIDQSTGATAGELTALTANTIGTGALPQYAALDPSGTHLYVANGTDNSVSAYTVAAGVLTQIGASATTITGAASVYSVVVDPADKFLYVLDAGILGNGQVFSYTIGAGGAIVAPAVSSVLIGLNDGPFSNSLAIDPTGAFLAVTNNFDFTISPVTVASGGVLTAQPTVPTGNSPNFIVFFNAP